MSVRTPAILAVSLLVLLLLNYFVLSEPSQKLLVMVWEPRANEEVLRLEVTGPGRPPLVIEARGNTAPGQTSITHYELSQPVKKTADRSGVADIVSMFTRLLREDAIDASGKNLAEYGLQPARLQVKLETTQRSMTVRLGREESAQRGGYPFIYCMVDGDDRFIYHWFKGFADILGMEVNDWRTKEVISFQPHKVSKARIQVWTPVEKTPERKLEEFELVEEGGRQWWIQWGGQPPRYRDQAEADRVNLVFDLLNQLRAVRFEPFSTPEKLGLDDPILKVQLFFQGNPQPIEATFSRYFEEKEKDKDGKEIPGKTFVYVHVQGSDEAAYCEAKRIRDDFPGRADIFRPRAIFFYNWEDILRVELECRGQGEVRLALVEEEQPSPRPNQPKQKAHVWTILQPPGFEETGPHRQAQQQRIWEFLDQLRHGEVMEFMVPKLDKSDEEVFKNPECKLTLTLRRGKESEARIFCFKTEGKTAFCYRRLSPNSYEVYRVPPLLVDALKRMEWNFHISPVLQFNPMLVQKIMVEHQGREKAEITKVVIEEPNQSVSIDWKSNLENDRSKLSKDNLNILLQRLAKLHAERYFSKDETQLEKYYLKPPYLRLRLVLRDPKEKTESEVGLAVSAEINGAIYYAKIDGVPIIFQLHQEIVQLIERLHVRPF